ncbi:MAG: DUF1549 domain-containing protein [Bryobacterales bacterium]|nr:DUF1549 domain-containing protein [Bryobacterales bacterium]
MNRMLALRWILAIALGATCGNAADVFRESLLPVLQTHCAKCHSGNEPGGNLRMETLDHLVGGGKRGPAIVPGNSNESLLIQLVRGEKTPRMPMGGVLPEKVVSDLAVAIDRMDAGKTPTARNPYQAWLFAKPLRPAPPVTRDPQWVKNPIDSFILAQLESKGLQPAPPANRRALIRRVYFDLTGVPPTPEEVEAFTADSSPGAYANLVDRLLADRRYGERWARHWLDLARFAETDGFAVDSERPTAWRYRDYVIRAFRDDKPYDLFIKEQLAGDETKTTGPPKQDRGEKMVALGFLRNGTWLPDANFQTQNRQDFLDDMTATMGSVFLGLTLGCARCHDHKYDPIPQKDYYRLQAFFASTRQAEQPIAFTPEESPASLRRKVRELEDEYDATAELAKSVEAEMKKKFAASKKMKPEDVLPPMLNRAIKDTKSALFTPEERKRFQSTQDSLARIEDALPRYRPVAYAVADVVPPDVPAVQDTHVLLRGELDSKGEKVESGFPRIVLGAERPAEIPFAGARTSGRRNALAEWIASPGNPLTARVMMNRVWQHHFGEGLVRTPSDFGLNGDRTVQPQLLDWLATEFVIQKWSIKAMHRLMLLSATYQQATSHPDDGASAKIDPENRYFWRMNWLRLDAESLRDSVLAMSGKLRPSEGGPGVYFHGNAELAKSFPQFHWFVSGEREQGYRSIYGFQRRSMMMPMFEVFDGANMSETCPRRQTTTVAPQALTLFNGAFVNEHARHLASRIVEFAGPNVDRQIDRAFRVILGRPPTKDQTMNARGFLGKSRPEDGLAQFAMVLLNVNEFFYLE